MKPLLSVRDEGAGIDPQMLRQIFDQFLQGDRSLDRSDGGLGIGLTVVKHLVEMHGGRVEAKSDGLGKGSEFRVYLPRVEPQLEVLPGAHRDANRSPSSAACWWSMIIATLPSRYAKCCA